MLLINIMIMPEFIFTKHVKLRIKQRDLDEKLIKETLENPEQISPGLFGRALAQKSFGDKTLEVVHVKRNNNFIIITAYFLRGGGKK